MDEVLAVELSKKAQLLEKIHEVAAAQNQAIKNSEKEKIISLDADKCLLMESMADIDNSIKPFILKNMRYPATVADEVKRINILLNNLIVIEKENEKLLSDMELSASGRHVEAYKRAVK